MTDVLEHIDSPDTDSQLDGLCFIGLVVKVEAVKFKGSDQPIDGLAKLTMTSSNGEFRIDLSKTAKQITGDVDLPAFPKLVNAMPDSRWIIKIWRTTSTTEGKTYTNYTAVDAQRL
jgi:hypothetical protein